MQPDFTPDDLQEARRLNARLDKFPRFRMQTTLGRLALNSLMWLGEFYLEARYAGRRPTAERKTITVDGANIALRIFRCAGTPRGVIVHYHGGGWTIGNARMSDPENAGLASRLDVTVVSVDYRLALARSLDDVIEECTAAAGWILDHAEQAFGSSRVIFQGSSAGSHLAASALLRLRDRAAAFGKIRGAMLAYGLYDFAGTGMVRHAGPDNLLLHGPTVRATLRKLTPHMNDAERRDGALSPLFANLIGLPRALFLVGEKDMLLEDNKRMAEQWQAATGHAALLIAPESPHAFDHFDTAIARKTQHHTDAWLLDRLG